MLCACQQAIYWIEEDDTHIALIEDISKPKSPPPITAIAAMKYGLLYFLTMVTRVYDT